MSRPYGEGGAAHVHCGTFRAFINQPSSSDRNVFRTTRRRHVAWTGSAQGCHNPQLTGPKWLYPPKKEHVCSGGDGATAVGIDVELKIGTPCKPTRPSCAGPPRLVVLQPYSWPEQICGRRNVSENESFLPGVRSIVQMIGVE